MYSVRSARECFSQTVSAVWKSTETLVGKQAIGPGDPKA